MVRTILCITFLLTLVTSLEAVALNTKADGNVVGENEKDIEKLRAVESDDFEANKLHSELLAEEWINKQVSEMNKTSDEMLKEASTDEDPVVKRTISYKVEGCFDHFKALATFPMGATASNGKCQELCRTSAIILAATKGATCYCGLDYPRGKFVLIANKT